MASAWGNSWGSAWGNSWGQIQSATQPSGGAGYPTGIWWGERKIKKGKRLDDILKHAMEQIIHGDLELAPETSVAKAVEIVKPYIETKKLDSIAPVSIINWKVIESDFKKVAELLKLWQEQVEAIEEEELLILAAYDYYY